MSKEQKNNSGALFKNDRKTEDTHSDYNGTAKIEGTDYWVNAWINTSKNGVKYMSLSFKVKDTQPSVQQDEGINEEEVPF